MKSVLARNDKLVFSKVDGEVIMLSIDNGEYYGLNQVGAEIWGYLNQPCSVETIIEKLRKYFEVSIQKCKTDTLPFIIELIQKKIIIIVEDEC
ncbi:MAG: PqqD family peptide modification chaperone [Bacteroidota bacterium]